MNEGKNVQLDIFMEKLGIYDLIAVFMTGAIVLAISIEIDTALIKSGLTDFINANDMIIFLVFSYFIGAILQEITSFIHRVFLFKNNKLLNQVFSAKNILDYYISKDEIKKLRTLVAKKAGDDVKYDNVFIYNMCKTYIEKSVYNSRINLDQAIAGLSRSLSFYLILLAVTMLILTLKRYNMMACLIIATASSIVSVLLFFRCVRFTKMRYSYILRTYLYRCLDL